MHHFKLQHSGANMTEKTRNRRAWQKEICSDSFYIRQAIKHFPLKCSFDPVEHKQRAAQQLFGNGLDMDVNCTNTDGIHRRDKISKATLAFGPQKRGHGFGFCFFKCDLAQHWLFCFLLHTIAEALLRVTQQTYKEDSGPCCVAGLRASSSWVLPFES